MFLINLVGVNVLMYVMFITRRGCYNDLPNGLRARIGIFPDPARAELHHVAAQLLKVLRNILAMSERLSDLLLKYTLNLKPYTSLTPHSSDKTLYGIIIIILL